MTDHSDAAAAAEALLRAQGQVPAASVTPLVSVVRSGEQFLILAPSGGGQSAGPLGRILIEWGYEVPKDKHPAFQAFLKSAHVTLRAPSVAGIEYLGTYTVFQQSDRKLGSFRTIWGYQNLSQMEQMTAKVADPNDAWGKAVKELMQFRDADYAAGRSQVILQLATETLV
ncbi:hypothetical protein [Plastoroseomonas hellenica]|uniref:NIPSNAP domain-containing protein n=1 Tax=Plastoroseomonas hellenica TaxID=2687306 RepID=A0ABS5F0H4_9PROT|nr:hypothetical protein [Plastoroseomonas hellenica]MBR0645647.1 hypothetical protein [Plastoroseomonas hellenica]MBR0666063.1 hypothetical protein [Plastoroseomonas hellenica]